MRGKIYRKLSINWYLMNTLENYLKYFVHWLTVLSWWLVCVQDWFLWKLPLVYRFRPSKFKKFYTPFPKTINFDSIMNYACGFKWCTHSFVMKEKWFSVLFFISYIISLALDLAPPYITLGPIPLSSRICILMTNILNSIL